MEGYIVTNDKGEKAWWDGEKLTPVKVDAGVKPEELSGKLKVTNQPPPGNLPPPPAEDIMKQGREMAVEDAAKTSGMLTRNVVVPAAQAGLAMATGGLSIPAQSAIGMGAEYGLQKAGLAPESTGNVLLQGALPTVGKYVAKGIKAGGRAVANVLGKGEQAGEQAAAKVLSVPAEGIERSTFRPSKAAYNAVEGQGAVDTGAAVAAVDEALQAEQALGSQANKQAIKTLEGIKNDLAVTPDLDAKELTARVQRLKKQADTAYRRNNPTLGSTLQEASDKFKASIPGLKAADVKYTRETVVDDIFSALRKSNKLKAVDDLIAEKGDKIRGVVSDKDLRDIRKIASQIVDIGGQSDAGIIKSAYEGTLRSFLSDPNGLTVFRHAFGPDLGKLTPAGISGLATFMRGYLAYKDKEHANQPENIVRKLAQ